MKRIIIIALSVLLFLAAAGVTVYPLISNYVNDKYQSKVHTNYVTEVEKMNASELDALKEAAQAYNDSLSPLCYKRESIQAAAIDYDALLDFNDSGIMGYVDIPKLSVNLPIYHGTDEETLQKGIGHLVGSALPIGGDGCHTVLTGHSGVAGKRLFSDLDQLETGDVFYLHVLNDTLAYQVTEINKVLPHETDLLTPEGDADLCTLITCYPYGVNSHRLLVRGSRIPYREAVAIAEEAKAEPVKSTWKEQYYTGLLIGGGAATGAVLVAILVLFLRKKRRKRHAQ